MKAEARSFATEEGFAPPQSRQININGIGYADRLRQLDARNVETLAGSMRQVGLINPIILRPQKGTGYWLIAGLHRLEAAKRLGWQSIPAIIVEAGDTEARLAEIDENLARGELSAAERAMHVSERKKLYEELHPETKSGKHQNRANQHGKVEDRKVYDPAEEALFNEILQRQAKRFSADTAAKTGRSESAVQKDAARGTKIDSIAKVVGTSLDKGEELDALAKLPQPQQEALIKRAAAGEKVSAKPVMKQLARAEKEKALAEKTITVSLASEAALYGVVYADPPWRFETYSEAGMDRSADNHYPTMDLEAIKALKVPAAQDAVLFLWATAPMLPEAIEVMRAWGFTYKSQIIWVKDRMGTGYWARNQHEILLIGTKGSIPAPAPGSQPSSVFQAPVSRHSEKPAALAEMIERLFPTTPKIELFCRSPRAGWAAHGNESEAA